MRASVVVVPVLLVLVTACSGPVPAGPPPAPPATSRPLPGVPPDPGLPSDPGLPPDPGVPPGPQTSLPVPSAPPSVPQRASGRYAVVPGGAPPGPGRGRVIRYLVEVERGLPFEPRAFAAEVHRTLNDRRGWGRFRRVDRPPVRLRVALSSPLLTDRVCRPLRTGGDLSCWNGSRTVVNARRWAEGVPQYGGDLAAYRSYVISHEVGHALGHRHVGCPGRGRPAPVMMQQSKALRGCRPNPWPHPEEGRQAR
ncbi:DUF3152 domain-containing protein [Nonomuraea sp. CA-218870]|uniref:DUF3152 domain-containing protein n=1 Tax=Nonomuraea sp. CA-218870 TaxID=3239998 RepID=UPI003D8ED49C